MLLFKLAYEKNQSFYEFIWKNLPKIRAFRVRQYEMPQNIHVIYIRYSIVRSETEIPSDHIIILQFVNSDSYEVIRNLLIFSGIRFFLVIYTQYTCNSRRYCHRLAVFIREVTHETGTIWENSFMCSTVLLRFQINCKTYPYHSNIKYAFTWYFLRALGHVRLFTIYF